MTTTTSSTRPAPVLTYADLPALMTLMTGDEKHDASATSTLDVLWVLYDQVLDVSPGRVDDPERAVPAVQGPRSDGLLRGARRSTSATRAWARC